MRDEVAKIKARIAKAERRLARGIDVHGKDRTGNPVSETETVARLTNRLKELGCVQAD